MKVSNFLLCLSFLGASTSLYAAETTPFDTYIYNPSNLYLTVSEAKATGGVNPACDPSSAVSIRAKNGSSSFYASSSSNQTFSCLYTVNVYKDSTSKISMGFFNLKATYSYGIDAVPECSLVKMNDNISNNYKVTSKVLFLNSGCGFTFENK